MKKGILILASTAALLLGSMAPTAFAAEPVKPAEKIHLNSASAEQLSTLKGVGKAKAEAIVAYRKEHGKFSSVDQLTEVKGIGDSILESNRMLLSLD